MLLAIEKMKLDDDDDDESVFGVLSFRAWKLLTQPLHVSLEFAYIHFLMKNHEKQHFCVDGFILCLNNVCLLSLLEFDAKIGNCFANKSTLVSLREFIVSPQTLSAWCEF